MPTPIENAVAALALSINSISGKSVTYYRAGGKVVPLMARGIVSSLEVVNDDGFGSQIEVRDFVITFAHLGFEPRGGDVIRETISGITCSFEVLQIGNLSCWEPHDNDGVMIVIHTKKIT